MELANLKYFISVVKFGSFNKAAQENYVTQPVISRRIKELEQELGCNLFVRTSQGVMLSSAGKVFLPKVEDALSILQIGIDDIQQFVTEGSDSYIIAANTPATYRYLPAAIGEFCLNHNSVSVSVDRMVPHEVYAALENGNHNLYITLLPDIEHFKRYKHILLAREKLYYICPKEQAPSSLDELRDQFANETLLMIPPEDSPILNQIVNHLMQKLKLAPKNICFVRPIESLFYSIASCLGVSILPQHICSFMNQGLNFMEMPTKDHVEIAAAWQEEDPLANAFVDILLRKIPD